MCRINGPKMSIYITMCRICSPRLFSVDNRVWHKINPACKGVRPLFRPPEPSKTWSLLLLRLYFGLIITILPNGPIYEFWTNFFGSYYEYELFAREWIYSIMHYFKITKKEKVIIFTFTKSEILLCNTSLHKGTTKKMSSKLWN